MAKGYHLIRTGRCDNGTYCQHCGRFIFNYAIIQGNGENAKPFRVGLDCKDTLCAIGQPKQLNLF